MAQRPASPSKQEPPKTADGRRKRGFLGGGFPYVRKAVITLAGCLAVSVALVGATSYVLALQKDAKNTAQTLNNQARERYTQSESEKREIHDFQPKYRLLVVRGFVGAEKRLDWIERMKHIQEQRKLLKISYEIFPQKAIDLDPSVQIGDLELHGSKMQLTMDLLHEMDLLNLLHDLKAGQSYVPTDCTIKQPASVASTPLAPRLSAECTLYWINLGPHPADDADQSNAGK